MRKTFKIPPKLERDMTRDELESVISTKTTSSKQSFSQEMREDLKAAFIPLMEEGTFLSGAQVDDYLNKNLPSILSLHGSVRCLNKYRELKAKFLRNSK